MDGWESSPPPPPASCSVQQQQHQYHDLLHGFIPQWNNPFAYNGGAGFLTDVPGFPTFENVEVISPGGALTRFPPFPVQPQSQAPPQPQPQPQPQAQPQPQPKPLNANANASGGSNGGSVTRKRGRPRKYAPSDVLPKPEELVVVVVNEAGADPVGSSATSDRQQPVDKLQVKRPKGRPKGSGKLQKQQRRSDNAGNEGPASDAFTGRPQSMVPEILFTPVGEDIYAEIQSFSKKAARSLCVISGRGTLCLVSVYQVQSGVIQSHKGLFEIISLSGLYTAATVDGAENLLSRLAICVRGADGRIIAGAVAGPLVAATQVQLTLLSFKYDKRNPQNGSIPAAKHTTPDKANEGPEAVTPSSVLIGAGISDIH